RPHAGLVSRLRAAWLSAKMRPMRHRAAQLEALGRFLDEKKQDILEATTLDTGKPPFEAELSEISICRSELNHTLNSLGTWMKDEHVEKNWVWCGGWPGMHGMGGRCPSCHPSLRRRRRWTHPSSDPQGPVRVVLIIGPWNYPINLLLVPLVRAIAAGNCVVMKPSKISRNVERSVAETLPRYLDKDCFAVVTAGVETTRLLENKFDCTFFTSSPSVGRLVMAAAPKRLTPVTLELGGKNPCYVSDTCDVQNVARQTRVAPDYVLCSADTQAQLLPALREAITQFYGPNPQESPDFGRMAADKRLQRVQALLRSGHVAIRGQTDAEARYIGEAQGPRLGSALPSQPPRCDPAMQEISGPVLTVDDAIAFINTWEQPLALYVFSSCKKHPPALTPQVLKQTSSGGFCANDTVRHVTLTLLPFGGIGQRGPGHYHGRSSFETFSHPRSALLRGGGREALNAPHYPPCGPGRLPPLRAATETQRRAACAPL
ncbi:AL3B1 dehydrogenase, partial [Calonectris borealis]|nr:AL3B1 dehydrogenase [Calonectris borealis]